ncbi:patatin-like phospholipase family protein, partial [Hyphomonas sp. UBA2654]
MQHKSFGLVLAGGGARGMAHVGALRALNHHGYFPSVVAGVSIGALVAATYSLNPNWYLDLREMDVSGFPRLPAFKTHGLKERIKGFVLAGRDLKSLTFGWGIGEHTVDWGRSVIEDLTLGKDLQQGRVKTLITATDILSGKRVIKKRGHAVDAVYASSAIAGILPPFEDGKHLLVDGGYSDSSPVDIVRNAGVDHVITLDPGQRISDHPPQNGLDVFMRSIEITHKAFSRSRYEHADLVLTPHYGTQVGLFDFQH